MIVAVVITGSAAPALGQSVGVMETAARLVAGKELCDAPVDAAAPEDWLVANIGSDPAILAGINSTADYERNLVPLSDERGQRAYCAQVRMTARAVGVLAGK